VRFVSFASARVWLIAAACFALCSLPARADLVEGTDYLTIEPAQPSGTQGKIEIVEFFSYACSHCFDMHPKVTRWAAGLPANASFVRVPVALGRREWGVLVRTYYALESLGELQRLDNVIFDAIHREKVRLFDESSVTLWLAQQGVPAGKFNAAFNSSQTSEKALRAEQMSYDYKVSGTPFVVVGGKYAVLGRTHDQTLSIAKELIDKVAAETKR
jgi:thiol:disulfide interchange protein DsbA